MSRIPPYRSAGASDTITSQAPDRAEMSDEHETPEPQDLPSADDGVDEDASMLNKVRAGSRRQRLEIYIAALMALATIGAAWASYESSRWGAVQTKNFNASNAARVESTKATTTGDQQVQIDVSTFFQLADAFFNDKTELFEFYRERARKEFQPALEEWLTSRPLKNPDAAKTPFALPSYQIGKFGEAEELVAEADEDNTAALTANQRSDNFVLSTVVFAAVLFLAGISSMFRWERVRMALVIVATVGFVTNSLWVATMPVVLQV
jgi:hypothetical protein